MYAILMGVKLLSPKELYAPYWRGRGGTVRHRNTLSWLARSLSANSQEDVRRLFR